MKIQRMTLRDTLTKRSMQKDRKILMLKSIAVIVVTMNQEWKRILVKMTLLHRKVQL